MKSKQWEYPKGWPENEAQRDELKNALLERMLAWDGGRQGSTELRWPSEPKSHAEIKANLRRNRVLPNRLPRRFVETIGEWLTGLHIQTQELIIRDGLNCHWCGRTCNVTIESSARAERSQAASIVIARGGRLPPLYPTRDHLVRRRDQGSNSLSNLVLACYECNTSRHAPGWKPPRP